MTLEPRVLELIEKGSRFVLTTHISSDGDGIGSQLALGRGLRSRGKDVRIVNPTPVPENLRFLLQDPGEIEIVSDLKDADRLFVDALTVVLDMGAFDRLGGVLPLARKSRGILVVDHHPMTLREGAEYLLDTEACATGEVTARILDALGIPLDAALAEPLYVAIQTDTGGFRYESTTPGTHRFAARLLETGVDPQRVYSEIYERQSPERLRLMAAVLATLEVSPSGAVASMTLTREHLARTGARVEDGDDLVNYTLTLEGVKAGFYFKEIAPDRTKVSCRSRGEFPINEFVSRWGGGGHLHAAGLRLDVPLDRAREMILSAAREALEPSQP